MESFAVMRVISLEGFPPPQPVELFAQPVPVVTVPEGPLSVAVLPGGHFGCVIRGKDGSVISQFVSQPVQFNGPSNFILLVWFHGNRIFIWINGGRHLLPCGDAPTTVRNGGSPAEFEASNSLEAADADIVCAASMKSRRDWLDRTHPTGPDVRPKTHEETIRDLENTLRSLELHLTGINQGKSYLIADVLTILRALLCWSNRYTRPLLFHGAAILDRPLPIYADRRNIDTMPRKVEKEEFSWRRSSAGTRRKSSVEKLMDIEEWLETSVAIRLSVVDANSSVKVIKKTVRELIKEAANHVGTAHLSAVKPYTVSAMEDFLWMGHTGLSEFVKDIAEMTLVLGKWLLKQGNR